MRRMAAIRGLILIQGRSWKRWDMSRHKSFLPVAERLETLMNFVL